jgi:hypothetical protein
VTSSTTTDVRDRPAAPRHSTIALCGHGMGLRLYEPVWFGPLPRRFQIDSDDNAVLLAAWPDGDEGGFENLFLVPDTDAGPVEVPLRRDRIGSVTLGLSAGAQDVSRFGEPFDFPDIPFWIIHSGVFEFRMPDALCKNKGGKLIFTQQGLEPDEFVSFLGPYPPYLEPTFDKLVASAEAAGQRVVDTGAMRMSRGTAEWLEVVYQHEGRAWRQHLYLCTDGVTAIVRGQSLHTEGADAIGRICREVVGTLRFDDTAARAVAGLREEWDRGGR